MPLSPVKDQGASRFLRVGPREPILVPYSSGFPVPSKHFSTSPLLFPYIVNSMAAVTGHAPERAEERIERPCPSRNVHGCPPLARNV